MKKGKAENAFDNLLSRQDYLVVQANDLAKAFGNLKAFDTSYWIIVLVM